MIRFVFVGFIFWVSTYLISENNPKDTYIAIYIIFVAALGSGIAVSQAPSIGKAKSAAIKVFDIIEEPSKIDTRDPNGEKVIKRGEIEFKKVDFKYPSRTQKVLQSMDMKITATKKIGLVGHSGCGKSTIANLLLRMYDITDG
jgi:ABC-type multidrug transport system fused ATPase/permease subunit